MDQTNGTAHAGEPVGLAGKPGEQETIVLMLDTVDHVAERVLATPGENLIARLGGNKCTVIEPNKAPISL